MLRTTYPDMLLPDVVSDEVEMLSIPCDNEGIPDLEHFSIAQDLDA